MTRTTQHNPLQHLLFSHRPQTSQVHELSNARRDNSSKTTGIAFQPFSRSVRDLAAYFQEQAGKQCGTTNAKNNAIVLHNKKAELERSDDEMVQLIPLVLQPSAQTKSVSFADPWTTSPAISVRPTPPSSPTPSISPETKRQTRPHNTMAVLPKSEPDWKKTMEEVKGWYAKRQYKQCTVRCKHSLDSIKDPVRPYPSSHPAPTVETDEKQSQIHPLYLVYLSFYAASSLEQTARSMHNNSSNKVNVFQDSLSYYQKAQFFLSSASSSVSTQPSIIRLTDRPHSPQNHRAKDSISSSNRSSVDSVFSNADSAPWEPSSAPPSPTSPKHRRNESACSTSSTTTMKPSPLRIRKKVSFSLQSATSAPEPDLLVATPSSAQLIHSFPSPPSPANFQESERDQYHTPEPTQNWLQTRSIARYQSHLTTFSTQLTSHISSIENQISAASEARSRNSSASSALGDYAGLGSINKEELKKVELRERIARLKAGGWKRREFDSERYKALCEKALAEVEGYY